MLPTVADALAELHELEETDESSDVPAIGQAVFSSLAAGPVPASLVRRLWRLGGLHAQIVRAYLAYWARTRFRTADKLKHSQADANLRLALKMFETMGYLRGAVMKLGQALTNLPSIVPDEIVATLERLHFEAPPMHFALLREQLRNELHHDPEDLFASFDAHAFAAASLGQVHRATLSSGEVLAVKIQYPGVARAIRADFRALSALLLPLRLSEGWDRLMRQLEDVRKVVEFETDYEREAASLRSARSLFTEDDAIVVPRVTDAFSTRRVLAMEYLDGAHIQQFLAGRPSQELRDRFGGLIFRAQARLHYAGRLLYADPSPGNFLFLPDGRLGFIDFGCVRPYNDEDWACCRQADLAIQAGPEHVGRALATCAGLEQDEQATPEQIAVLEAWCRWMWRPYWHTGVFDFGDEGYLRECAELLAIIAAERSHFGAPMAVFTTRWYLGTVAMLFRLRARVDVREIYTRERAAAGWGVG
jgi:hypothetical protein